MCYCTRYPSLGFLKRPVDTRALHDETLLAEAPAPVDSAAALKEALDLLAVRIAETGAQIDAQPLPRVMADRTQLVQLFQNLIGKALKFCKDQAPRVRVAATHEAGWWRFSVTDNGIGIAPEYRDQLRAYDLHANAYVTKPVDLAQFMKIVALIDEFWVNVVTLPGK
jgi:light-regulated signal transduction histidine kinase (bacteriophytochrome)